MRLQTLEDGRLRTQDALNHAAEAKPWDDFAELIQLLPYHRAELLGSTGNGLGACGCEALCDVRPLDDLSDVTVKPHDDGARHLCRPEHPIPRRSKERRVGKECRSR